MRNDEITPVFTGDVISNDYGTLYPEVVTLDGNVRLRLVLADGQELILPYEVLPLVGQNAGRMQGALTQYLELARLEEYKPSKRYASEALAPRKKNGSRNVSHNVFSRPAADLNEDATPYIVWKKNESGVHGWALTMAGIDDVVLGWAAWDDPTGVDELINNLDDVETCISIAGIVAPTPTSQMSARITAKALRSGRKLPGINVKKVRTIFESSDLLTPETISAWHAAQIKTLAIDSGDKKVPVAVAISAPSKFVGQATLSEEQVRNLTWQQRSAAETEILKPLVDEWIRKAKKIMLDSGWRLVDLNVPRNYYYGNGIENSTFWVTLINPELWSNVSAAAQDAANNFRMSRTTRI
jgi:hypothetical protein